jgi:hypothetical protein
MRSGVDEQREVVLLGDRGPFLDVEPAHDAALGARLMGHQRHAQHPLSLGANLVQRLGHLDAAAFAAAAGMDLRLHHPDRSSELPGRRHRFVD